MKAAVWWTGEKEQLKTPMEWCFRFLERMKNNTFKCYNANTEVVLYLIVTKQALNDDFRIR